MTKNKSYFDMHNDPMKILDSLTFLLYSNYLMLYSKIDIKSTHSMEKSHLLIKSAWHNHWLKKYKLSSKILARYIMKKIAVIILALALTSAINIEAKSPPQPVGFGAFYSQLSPYGSWLELNSGVVVWRPFFISNNWTPYMDGQWIWTSDGWYWDSYESFGYITYHYGRWYFDDYYGWLWVPDYDWAPAWVEWRYNSDYIGWSPLPPYAAFYVNVGIIFTTDYYTPYNHWHFVRYKYICDPYVHNYFAAPSYNYGIYSKTKYRTNYDYSGGRIRNRGVDVEYVRNMGGRNISERQVNFVNDPKEVTRTNVTVNNREVIRTYQVSKDEIKREGTRNVTIKKAERNSTLELNRIAVGENRNNIRTDDKNVRVRDERGDFKSVNSDRTVERTRTTETNTNVQRTEVNRTNTNRTVETPKTEVKRSTPAEVRQNTNRNTESNTNTRTQERKVETKREVKRTEAPKVIRKESSSSQNNSQPRTNTNSAPKKESAPNRSVETQRSTQRENVQRSNTNNNSSRSRESNNSKTERSTQKRR